MKLITLILSFTLGSTTVAQAKVFNWICNQEKGSEYQFLLSFNTETSEVTRKGKTWPYSLKGIYEIWNEAKRFDGKDGSGRNRGDVSAGIYVWDGHANLLHYKALHFKNGHYFGESGAAIKCSFLDSN